jgi:hypothetical protein
MVHGFVFGQFDTQQGSRGGNQLGSLNWGMLMVSHALAGGNLQFRTMLSLDAVGVTARGYPLLLQTGESYDGQPLHDRQHPHDLWMELGMLYERPLAHDFGVLLYVAPSGEPALGPVAFMHRPSAMDNPVVPLAHHWQDATHISFGVLTSGIFTHRWRLEGSVFNGREPDQNRWDFDPLRLDSYSGRLTVNPTDHWSLTLGYGSVTTPEAPRSDESVRRLVASVLYGRRLGSEGQWATTVVYGVNMWTGSSPTTHSTLLENDLILDWKNTLFGRGEYLQKSAQDLALQGFASDQLFRVLSLGAGYIREMVRAPGATLGLGTVVTINVLSSELEPFYGSRTPLGAMLFLRLRPSWSRAPDMPMGM